MYSAYKLNNQSDNIQPWRTPFPICNQSVVPWPVLSVASWPAYRFLKRQVRWSDIPISFRISHSIGTWNVRSMNQGKLEVVKQEMARVNVDILGISELNWTGMGEFNSEDHYIYFCGQESLRNNGVAIMVNRRVRNAVLGCNLKNDRIISVSKANNSISW